MAKSTEPPVIRFHDIPEGGTSSSSALGLPISEPLSSTVPMKGQKVIEGYRRYTVV
jgi:hypothetical protein